MNASSDGNRATDASVASGGILTRLRFLLSQMSIPHKMLAGYSVLAVLSLSVILYVLVSISMINRLNLSIVEVDIPMAANAGKMIDALLDQDGYEKRYLILRGGDLRTRFEDRSREFNECLSQMKRISRGQGKMLEELGELHGQYERGFSNMVELVRKNRTLKAQRLSRGMMNLFVDRMLERLREIPKQAQASRAKKMRRIAETSRTAFRTTVVLCLFTTAVSILVALMMTFSITAPLRKLTVAASHVGEGKFDIQLGMGAKDEVSELARAFDQMAHRLKKLEEMYLDASPLTRLPGGVAIEREIQGRLDRREPLALCVMDLDNFKAYNDRYGYERGNSVIKEAARIIETASTTHGGEDDFVGHAHGGMCDFVGHVGGDDFVVVTTPEWIDTLCKEVIAQFDRKAPEFYSEQDRAAGYIMGKTRQGVEMRFPIVSISIAVVTNTLRSFDSPLEMAEVAAELKEYAKTFARSIYVVDKRRN